MPITCEVTRFRSVVRFVFAAGLLFFISADNSPVRAGEGDEPLVDDRIQQTWADLDLQLFHDTTSYALGVFEQREKTRKRTEEARFKRIWLTHEGQAFSRMVTDLLDDTETFTRRRDKLREASEVAGRFTQVGLELPGYRTKFVDLVMLTAYRDEVRERMAKEIGPLAPADFAGQRLFNIVSPDGDLESPPPSLLETNARADGEKLFGRFRDEWLAAASDLRADRAPRVDRSAAMWSVLDEWEKSLIDAQDLPSPAAVNYIDDARRLVGAIASPGERFEVTAFLRDRGHAFPGGTYGDLLFHVLKHRLYPKAGTPGSLAVAELVQAMSDRADLEVVELDKKLERLKRQNPAHNAVLRERMVPRYFADKSSIGVHAGLNSPAYEEE